MNLIETLSAWAEAVFARPFEFTKTLPAGKYIDESYWEFWVLLSLNYGCLVMGEEE